MEEADSYLSISIASSGMFRDRGSKFLGFAFPVKTEADVKEILQHLKKEHVQASHHCYAFRLGTDPVIYRSSDDREPSGTAGKPILGTIQSMQLTDILVVVARYFGGMLLGVPGLINAYRSAAHDALQQATIVSKTVNIKFEISFPYECMNDVHSLLKAEGATILSQNYNDPCKIQFEIRKSKSTLLVEKLKKHPILVQKANWKLV